jgi:cob(I)alamin adenosyltransferase
MVRLDRITTRTGDDGTTGLSDGSRLSKHDPLIAALGSVDEANSWLGLASAEKLPKDIAQAVAIIQNDLFDLGGDLATPTGGRHEDKVPRITDAQVTRLEKWIASGNAELPPLTSFVMPGGTRAAALMHMARTVVRRAERDVVAATATRTYLNNRCRMYLNRLSDLLFVWARQCNAGHDPLWKPGANR